MASSSSQVCFRSGSWIGEGLLLLRVSRGDQWLRKVFSVELIRAVCHACCISHCVATGRIVSLSRLSANANGDGKRALGAYLTVFLQERDNLFKGIWILHLFADEMGHSSDISFQANIPGIFFGLMIICSNGTRQDLDTVYHLTEIAGVIRSVSLQCFLLLVVCANSDGYSGKVHEKHNDRLMFGFDRESVEGA